MGWSEALARVWRSLVGRPGAAETGRPGAGHRFEETWTVPSPRVRTIVATTDLSELSLPAVAYAAGLAARLGTALVVVHIADEDDAYEALRDHGMYLDQFLRWRKAMVEDLLRDTIPQATLAVAPPLVRVEFGRQAASEIARLAREASADLIVMATHGRTGLGRLILGSVAEQVVREAACPVVLLRPTGVAASTPVHA